MKFPTVDEKKNIIFDKREKRKWTPYKRKLGYFSLVYVFYRK